MNKQWHEEQIKKLEQILKELKNITKELKRKVR